MNRGRKIMLAASGEPGIPWDGTAIAGPKIRRRRRRPPLWVEYRRPVFGRPGFGDGLGGDEFRRECRADEEEVEKYQQRTQDACGRRWRRPRRNSASTTQSCKSKSINIKPAGTSYVKQIFRTNSGLRALPISDYARYTHTGFGPQFLENMNPPGPLQQLTTRSYQTGSI